MIMLRAWRDAVKTVVQTLRMCGSESSMIASELSSVTGLFSIGKIERSCVYGLLFVPEARLRAMGLMADKALKSCAKSEEEQQDNTMMAVSASSPRSLARAAAMQSMGRTSTEAVAAAAAAAAAAVAAAAAGSSSSTARMPPPSTPASMAAAAAIAAIRATRGASSSYSSSSLRPVASLRFSVLHDDGESATFEKPSMLPEEEVQI